VWRSDDAGRNWTAATAGLPQAAGFNDETSHTSRYHALRVAASDPDVLVTANQAWGSEALYRSTDGGATWVELLGSQGFRRPPTAYGTPVSADALAIDPTDPGRILAGNGEFVLRTRDAGRTWEDVSSDLGDEGGHTGRGLSGLVANRVSFNATGVTQVLCGFDGANPLVSTAAPPAGADSKEPGPSGGEAGGVSWRRPVRAWDNWGGCIDTANSATQWWALLGQGELFNGIARFGGNDGSAQVAAGSGSGLPERGTRLRSLGGVVVTTGPDGGLVVLATLDGALYRSRDGGATFARSQPAADLRRLTVDPARPGTVYVAGGDGIWRSDDAGTTFLPLPGSPARAERITVGPDRVYATVWRGGGAGLWAAVPGGGWEPLSAEPTAFEVAVNPADPAHLVLATNDHPYHDVVRSVGVLESRDGGRSWVTRNEGLPLLRISAVAFDPGVRGRIVIGTFGAGFFELRSDR
jgi:hypothetical protein